MATVHYGWRVRVPATDDSEEYLGIPWADPHLYEFSFDFMFDTPELAVAALGSFDVEEEESADWILVRVETTEIPRPEAPQP